MGRVLKKPRVTASLDGVNEQLNGIVRIRVNRSKLTREECLTVLHIFYSIHVNALGSNSTSHVQLPINATVETAQLTGRSMNTISKIVKKWADAKQGTTEPFEYTKESNQGNLLTKKPRVRLQKRTVHAVRDFFIGRRVSGGKLASSEALQFLVPKKILKIDYASVTTLTNKQHRTALRAVQRFLK